jgi:hypothetical protein
MRTNLNHGARLDERCNLFPSLAMLFQTLKEEAVLFRRPAASIFPLSP